VARQWEELILGVPLLMTRLEFLDGAKPTTVLVGMIYSRNPVKLSFRVTSLAEAAPEAEAKWREVLNGIRTLSGSLPKTEDPTQVIPEQQSAPSDPRITVLAPKPAKVPRPNRSDKVEPLDILGQSLGLRLPRAWSVVKSDAGYSLTHPRLKGELKLDFGAGQAADMARATAAGSNSLNTRFQTVSLREEREIGLNRSGSRMYQISRRGTDQAGPLLAIITGGHQDLHYWVTLYTTSDFKDGERDTRLLQELHQSLSLGLRT
jgi:hypothetical protein